MRGVGGQESATEGWVEWYVVMLLLKYENKIGMHYFQTVGMIQFIKKIVFLVWKQ